MEVLIESEMQQITSEWPTSGSPFSQVHLSESGELHSRAREVIDMDYKEEDDLDFDDDEKTALYSQWTISNFLKQ